MGERTTNVDIYVKVYIKNTSFKSLVTKVATVK